MTCPASFTQNSFRGRNDDGDQATATWKATQGTDWSQARDVNFRVRFQMQEGAACGKNNVVWRLQYNLAGAGWVNCSASSLVVRASASANFTDGAATTDQLTGGTGTFQGGGGTTGGMDEGDCNAGGASMDLAASGHAEAEFCVQIRSADVAIGQTLQLRVSDAGSALASYTSTPTITATGNQSVTAGLGEMVLTGQAPTVFILDSQSVAAGLGELAFTGQAPTVFASDNVSITAGLASLELTGQAPANAVTDHVFITAGLGELSLSGQAPTVSKTDNVFISPDVGALTITGYAPSIDGAAHISITSALGELVLTGNVPTVSATQHVFINPETGALAITGYEPSIQAGGSVSISAELGELILSAFSPVVSVTAPSADEFLSGGNWRNLAARKKARKVRYSDFENREDYATALAETLAESSLPIRSSDDEDDEILLQALTIYMANERRTH